MVATDCTIRERRDDDLPALAAALVRVHAQDGYPVEGVADPISWLRHPRAIRNWSALVADMPVGQVTLTAASADDDAARVWVAETGGSLCNLAIVIRLFIDPAHRSAGAGRLLMEAALSYARSAYRSVALDVMAKDHAAIRLYGRLGARRLGPIEHQHGDGLIEPAIVFTFSA